MERFITNLEMMKTKQKPSANQKEFRSAEGRCFIFVFIGLTQQTGKLYFSGMVKRKTEPRGVHQGSLVRGSLGACRAVRLAI